MKKLFAFALASVVVLAPLAVFAQTWGGSSSSSGGGMGSTPGTMGGTGSSGSMGTGSSGGMGSSAGAADTSTIQQAQRQLKAAGFDPGSDSGVMDSQTRDALREYQRSKGLTATGQLDQQTQQALLGSGSSSGSMGYGSSSGSYGSGTTK